MGEPVRHTVGLLAALILLAACDADAGNSGPDRHGESGVDGLRPGTTTTVAAPSTAQGPRTEKWIDLQVGDCWPTRQPSDPSVVTVSVVDCAIAHAAEVYLRADVEVNAAIADVADRECNAGFTRYNRAIRRRQPVRGHVPDRLQSRPDVGQSAAKHRHLRACWLERRAADGLRAPLTPLHPDRLRHKAIRGRRRLTAGTGTHNPVWVSMYIPGRQNGAHNRW